MLTRTQALCIVGTQASTSLSGLSSFRVTGRSRGMLGVIPGHSGVVAWALGITVHHLLPGAGTNVRCQSVSGPPIRRPTSLHFYHLGSSYGTLFFKPFPHAHHSTRLEHSQGRMRTPWGRGAHLEHQHVRSGDLYTTNRAYVRVPDGGSPGQHSGLDGDIYFPS